MTWHFENDRPIYTQLLEQIRLRIISGIYAAGSRLPSVRELAGEAEGKGQRDTGDLCSHCRPSGYFQD